MIDTDTTKKDIKTQVKELREEIPELQDVALSQTKADLIDDVEEALHQHAENNAGSIPDDDVMESQDGSAVEAEQDDTGDDAASDETSERQAGNASSPPAAGPNPLYADSAFGRAQ